MEPTIENVDAMYAERVMRARQTPLEEKLVTGLRLLSMAREAVRAGIRATHPSASDAEVEDLLWRREELGDKLRGNES